MCMDLIVKHELYERGMSLFITEPTLSQKFWLQYGKFLLNAGRFNEGGNAFLKCKDNDLALSCFQVKDEIYLNYFRKAEMLMRSYISRDKRKFQMTSSFLF